MPRFMSKKVILTMGLALVLAAGGVATASNMGFKFVKNYSAIIPQTNTLALPYFQSQFTKARNIWNDIPGAVNGQTQVCRLNANESRDCWTGDLQANFNWPTVIGDAVIIRNNVSTSTWVPDHY